MDGKMFKNRVARKFTIVSFLICIVIGLCLANQMKTSAGERLYVSPQTVEYYKTTIGSEKQEVEKLREKVKEAREKLEGYEDTLQSGDWAAKKAVEENLKEEKERYQMASGMEAVKGPGVEVIIDDGVRDLFYGENINDILVHDTDIILVINELNRSGAEAVSVNGQRITPNTSICCSGYTVRINGEVYARPFKIRAIGDGGRMAAALVGPEGYGTSLKDWGIQFEVRLKDDITMEPCSKEYLYTYTNKIQGR